MESVFKSRNEKDILNKIMWEIVLRNVKDENGNEIDDAGCNWFTLEDKTFIGSTEWCVSTDYEIADLINAINALNSCPELINQEPK